MSSVVQTASCVSSLGESRYAQYNPLSTRSTSCEHVHSVQEPAASGPRDRIVLRGHGGDAGRTLRMRSVIMLKVCPSATPAGRRQPSEPNGPLRPTTAALSAHALLSCTRSDRTVVVRWLPELLGDCACSQRAVVRGRGFVVASGRAWLFLWSAHGAGSRPRPHPELPYLFGIFDGLRVGSSARGCARPCTFAAHSS